MIPDGHTCNPLEEYHVLYTPAEQVYDDITETVAKLCKVPVCLISLLDRDRSRFFFKSHFGIPNNECQIEHSAESAILCLNCMRQESTFVVEDTLKTFSECPYVKGPPYIRFYAGSPLKTPTGVKIGTLCVIDFIPRIITEEQMNVLCCMGRQVVTQLELRRRNEESVMIQNQLLSSNKRLQKLDAERIRFIGMISHDIRQAVCTVQVSSELLLADKTLYQTEELRELAESAVNAAEYMSHLLDDLLEITKPYPCNGDNTRRVVDPVPLINRTVLANTRLASRKDISLTLNMEDTVEQGGIRLNINIPRIERVLNNLISNAIKFSLPKTSIHVTVKKQKQDLVLDVKDEGQGIPESDLPYVFGGLRTINVKPTGNETSTGLGLAIVKQIVDQHGGQISVISKVNYGTTFTVRLPIVTADLEKRTPDCTALPQLQHSLKILVAEDNLMNQKLLHTALSRRGHDVICVNDGLTAVDEFKKGLFNVVLLDNDMPVMDGGTAAKCIKEINPGTPIISISGSDVENGQQSHLYCAFLSKPYNLNMLFKTIESVCVSMGLFGLDTTRIAGTVTQE